MWCFCSLIYLEQIIFVSSWLHHKILVPLHTIFISQNSDYISNWLMMAYIALNMYTNFIFLYRIFHCSQSFAHVYLYKEKNGDWGITQQRPTFFFVFLECFILNCYILWFIHFIGFPWIVHKSYYIIPYYFIHYYFILNYPLKFNEV